VSAKDDDIDGPATEREVIQGEIDSTTDEAPKKKRGAHRAPDEEEASPVVEEATPALGAELSALRNELDERTHDLQRVTAEYANYRKRVDRDRAAAAELTTGAVLTALLPVLDDIDRARDHGELEGGFKAVADSLERIVSGLGLTKFGAPGEPFDPNVHEALAHGHSPDVSETVVEHLAQAGYRIGDRVVRAAKVTVLDPEG